MGKKDVVNFAPTGEKKRRHIPRYVSVIVILCLVAFVASVVVILAVNDFDIGKALGAREVETSADETTLTSGENISPETDGTVFEGSVNFLVLCSDSNALTFCQLVSADISAGKIKIKPIPLDYKLDIGSETKSIGELFGKSSYKDLCCAFLSKNIEVSRYIHVTEDNFKRLMSNLGQVPVEISGSYEFNVDAVKYTFAPGIQNMTSDMLLKYMKYATDGEALLRLQGNASADIFRQHFTADNFSKGDSFFSMLINFVDSNITAFDYTAAKSVLGAMLSGDVQIAVVS